MSQLYEIGRIQEDGMDAAGTAIEELEKLEEVCSCIVQHRREYEERSKVARLDFDGVDYEVRDLFDKVAVLGILVWNRLRKPIT
jgi:hypothetical protein